MVIIGSRSLTKSWLIWNMVLLLWFCILFPSMALLGLDDSFQIFNKAHKRCVEVQANQKVMACKCDLDQKRQRWRWTSGNHLMNVVSKLCLTASGVEDYDLVAASKCQSNNSAQAWECRDLDLLVLQGRFIHLNWRGDNFGKMVMFTGKGDWSRWIVFETQRNLCTQIYQEVFTIGGNSRGEPCVFPFAYGGNIYDQCTFAGRNDRQLWCATTDDYNQDNLFGFCPNNGSSCDVFWHEDPRYNGCYEMNVEAVLSWYEAQRLCQQQGADLLSISDVHTQHFISGFLSGHGASLWIGLNVLDPQGGWQWVDDAPFRYVNWAEGFPFSMEDARCGVLDASKFGRWKNADCSRHLGYICFKRNASQSVSLPPPPEVNRRGCAPGWMAYGTFCYHLVEKPSSWKDALIFCRASRGDLASLVSEPEFQFFQHFSSSAMLWIGLNSHRDGNTFDWSDGSPVDVTHWQVNHPVVDSSKEGQCVSSLAPLGRWVTIPCEMSLSYVCKRPSDTADHAESPAEKGCKKGWKKHGFSCFLIGKAPVGFELATKYCVANGGYLASILIRGEQAFISSLLGLPGATEVWLGLSDKASPNSFIWHNGDPVTFTNWAADQPGSAAGCVVASTGRSLGLWFVRNCDDYQAVPLCKTPVSGMVAPTASHSSILQGSCPTGWQSQENLPSCYQVNGHERGSGQQWRKAQKHCTSEGAELLSIGSTAEAKFVQNIIGRAEGTEVWIGLNSINPELGFTWADGSPVRFVTWRPGEPNNARGMEHCVTTDWLGQWSDHHCDAMMPWVCKVRKGKEVNNISMKKDEDSGKVPSGWIPDNGYLYYFNMSARLPVGQAQSACLTHGASLVSLHSKAEWTFVWSKISHSLVDDWFIGMKVGINGRFRWLDGTFVTFIAWETGEPGLGSHTMEQCVSMESIHGEWRSVGCEDPRAFICRKHNVTGLAPPQASLNKPQGGCPQRWKLFNNKCYAVHKEKPDFKSWKHARDSCKDEGGDLVSITNVDEQMFMVVQLQEAKFKLWTGLNDIKQEGYFVWSDGTPVNYTNWSDGRPVKSPQDLPYECDCVSMLNYRSIGTWRDDICNFKRGYVCQKATDPTIAVIKPHPVTELVHFGKSFFRVDTTPQPFAAARKACQSTGADIASLISIYEHAFVSLLARRAGGALWIGLNANETAGAYHWLDGWHMPMSGWATNEPAQPRACVRLVAGEGWMTESCSKPLPVVCKKSAELPPTMAPVRGPCPSEPSPGSWQEFRDSCFLFQSDTKLSWMGAAVTCSRLGGSLASLKNSFESRFVERQLKDLRDKAKRFWIGLHLSSDGGISWLDGSPISYTRLRASRQQGGNRDSSGVDERCVAISSKAFSWEEHSCTNTAGYICRAYRAGVIESTPTAANVIFPSRLGKQEQRSYRILLATLLPLVLLGAVVAAVGLLWWKGRCLQPHFGFRSFTSSLYQENDEEILTPHFEQNH